MKLIKKIFFIIIFLFSNVNAFAFTDPNNVDNFDISDEITSTTVKFSQDGKTMFILGVNTDTIRQYSLSTAFDLSSPPVAVKTFDIGSIQDAPQDLEFNSDGTVLFVIGREGGNRGIHQCDSPPPPDLVQASEAEFWDLMVSDPQPLVENLRVPLPGPDSEMAIADLSARSLLQFSPVSTSAIALDDGQNTEPDSPRTIVYPSCGPNHSGIGHSSPETCKLGKVFSIDIRRISSDWFSLCRVI